MQLTLVISTYNNPSALDRILDALRGGTRQADEVIVADDGSTNETKELITNWASSMPAPIIHCWHEDKGFRKTKILNNSIKVSKGEYLVFLDGDCIPEKNFISDHRKLAEQNCFVQGRRAFIQQSSVPDFLNQKTGLLKLLFTGKISGIPKAIRWPMPFVFYNQKHRGLIGCNLAMWKTDLLDINGFDEAYEGWGVGEDSDLCIRLYNKGLQRKFVYGRMRVYHLNHNEADKSHYCESKERLQETIDSKKLRCKKGLEAT